MQTSDFDEAIERVIAVVGHIASRVLVCNVAGRFFAVEDRCSHANVALEDKELVLSAEDETKLRNMNEILQQKLVRRGVPLKAFSYDKSEPAAGGTVRQRAHIQQGIPQEKAKEIVRVIKDSKVKVQAAIQGDVVRVTGKDRDTLQDIIGKLKAKDFGIHMQFTNYRTH